MEVYDDPTAETAVSASEMPDYSNSDGTVNGELYGQDDSANTNGIPGNKLLDGNYSLKQQPTPLKPGIGDSVPAEEEAFYDLFPPGTADDRYFESGDSNGGSGGSASGGSVSQSEGKTYGSGKPFEKAIFEASPVDTFTLIETPDKVPFRIGICFYSMGNLVFDLKSPLTLKYNKDVVGFEISSNVLSFGTRCVMQLALMEETAHIIKEKVSDLMCAITIMQCSNNITSEEVPKMESSIIYEPYIFMVESFNDGPPSNSTEKIYELQMLDIDSYFLKNSAFGNLREKYPEINNAMNFTEVYKKIISFLAEKKSVLLDGFEFNDVVEFASKDTTPMPDIVKMVLDPFFNNVERSLYELLCVLQDQAVMVVKPPNFADAFAGKDPFSDPMSSLFLMNEYPDIEGSYYNVLDATPEKELKPEEVSYKVDGTIPGRGLMLRRKYFVRSLRSPFELAFADDKCTFFQTFNPRKDNTGAMIEEDAIIPKPILGYTVENYENCAGESTDGGALSSKWQNVLVVYDANGGGNSYLIYFYWVYEYFNHNYLNFKGNLFAKKVNKPLMMSIDPGYLQKQRHAASKIKDAEEYGRFNATTIAAKTVNRDQESSFIIAQRIKTCVLSNECYKFDVKGNILRRNNEIIKVNVPKDKEPGTVSTISKIPGGKNAAGAGIALLYIGAIWHTFNGNKFTNTIGGYNFARFMTPQ